MNGFDFLAPVYDRMARIIFGDEIKKSTVAFFDHIKDGDKVLVVGGGTGDFLPYIRQKVNITYVELSAGMIEKAKTNGISRNITFIHGSYTSVPDKLYDVIITPFFLDIFTESTVEKIVKHLNLRLRNGGILLLADFQQNNIFWQKALIWLMIKFFRLTAHIEARIFPDYKNYLTSHFRLIEERYFFRNMIWSVVFKKAEE